MLNNTSNTVDQKVVKIIMVSGMNFESDVVTFVILSNAKTEIS